MDGTDWCRQSSTSRPTVRYCAESCKNTNTRLGYCTVWCASLTLHPLFLLYYCRAVRTGGGMVPSPTFWTGTQCCLCPAFLVVLNLYSNSNWIHKQYSQIITQRLIYTRVATVFLRIGVWELARNQSKRSCLFTFSYEILAPRSREF